MVLNPRRKMKPQEIIDNTKAEILINLREKLSEMDKDGYKEIYFSDIVTEAVDCNTPTDRMEAMALIDETGNEKYVDEGIIDTSCLDRMIITTAYECLYQEIFNDSFFCNDLQDAADNQKLSFEEAQDIIKLIDEKLPGYGEVVHVNNENHLWIEIESIINGDDTKVSIADFQRYFPSQNLKTGQIMELGGNSIKIFTSNNEINKNAMVLENIDKDEFRVYLMNKDKDLDIRKLFLHKPKTIQEGNYDLRPETYIDGNLKTRFDTKDEFLQKIYEIANYLLVERGQKIEVCNS